MDRVIEIIKSLENTSSTNEKVAILKSNKDNELLKKVLEYTYNDNMQFGLSEKKLRELLKDYEAQFNLTWKDGFEMLDTLSSSNINDELRSMVLEFLDIQPSEELKELWIRIITKDLRINAGAKLINKAIPKIIPTFEIQQAYQISKYPPKGDRTFVLDEKLNGINCSFLNGVFLSRQGKEIKGLDHIKEQLEKLSFNNYYFNGELIRDNVDGISNGENFRMTTSIVNSDAESKDEIGFVIFDLLPIEEFYAGKSKLEYKDRLKQLNQVKDETNENKLNSLYIPQVFYIGRDIDAIDENLEIATKMDLEGLMFHEYEGKDSYWKSKRHRGILKIKKFMETDCKVIDVLEGEGRLKGTLGALVCEYKGNTVNVGSGYDDSTRSEIWSNRDNVIGRYISIKYKEETQDKKSKLYSLQFPIYLKMKQIGEEINGDR